jgi:penicillin-binding protein 1A
VKQLYVGSAQTFDRKINEAALAWQMEDVYTKDQILAKYLNTVYFGEGAYGVQAAAQRFFNEDASSLTLAQSATLAGLIAAPTAFDPFLHPKAAVARRQEVLAGMLSLSVIDQQQYDHALSMKIHLTPASTTQNHYIAPYFVDYTYRWLLTAPQLDRATFGPPCPAQQPYKGDCPQRWNLLFEGGLRINTTLEPQLQTYAERAVHSVLPYRGDPYAAMTVIDPRTGFVRAMVGGRNYFDPKSHIAKLNLATGGSTGRQAGSSFKPFALVAALENGMSPQTVFSAPASIDIPIGNGKFWHVTNAEPSGFGSLTLEQATIESVNTVYAQVIEQVGPEKVIEAANRMGIRTCCKRTTVPTHPLLPYLSAVLGTNEVNTVEMASAYGTFATGGQHVNPTPISSITDVHGSVLWRAQPQLKQMVDPAIISVADGILQKVVQFGTGTYANIGRPQIGKTGTGQNYDNAWFVGAVPQLVASVWVGFPQGSISMQPPRTRITVFGGTWPAQIWHAFMVNATKHMPPKQFPTTQANYVSVAVDVTQTPYCLPNPYTIPANIQTLQFIQGTQPTKTCRQPSSAQSITVPSVIGLSQSAAEARLRNAGFTVQVRLARSSQPVGTVVAQSPAAGTQASATSTVTITVSRAVPPAG